MALIEIDGLPINSMLIFQGMLNNQMVIYMIIYTIIYIYTYEHYIYTYEHYIYIKKWDRRTWEDGDWVLYVGTAQKGPFWSFLE